jgi:type IV secretory pathway VirD2 relaxase
MRMVVLAKAGRRSTPTHLRYLERDGTTPEGERGAAYGPLHDQVDTDEFERRGRGDRHQFRFIVSAEDGAELKDLKGFTRDLMGQMERDLGTRLEWVAVDHWDTEHPHTHIVLRGKDQNGKDLIIAREYIGYGMRSRASEIATEWLGPRPQQDLDASALREVTQERWTGLDSAIERAAIDGQFNIQSLAQEAQHLHQRAAILGRLNHLATMGLAEQTRPGVWQISADAPEVLRAMGERGDIVRTMQRAMGEDLHQHQVFDAARGMPVTGRVVAKGLHDELTDRGYVIVEGLDGRAHYATLSGDVDITRIPKGAIVSLRGADTRAADRNILAVAQGGVYRADDHLRQLRKDAMPPTDPPAVVEAHVRRLEALRRGGLVERLADGVWRIPQDLPERGRSYDLNRLGGATVDLRCHLPIERQVRAIGATWLDQELIKGSALPNTEFGSRIRQALTDREEFLQLQGLARREGSRVSLNPNLLATLRQREIAAEAARIERMTQLSYRPTQDGVRVAGTYRESVQLTSGRFAVLDDGVGFSLVPWRPVIEKRLGQAMSAVIDGGRVNWELGRSRSLSL